MPRTHAVLKLYLLEPPSQALSSLRQQLPELVVTPLGIEVPLADRAPEEILALVLGLGLTARATRIFERLPVS